MIKRPSCQTSSVKEYPFAVVACAGTAGWIPAVEWLLGDRSGVKRQRQKEE